MRKNQRYSPSLVITNINCDSSNENTEVAYTTHHFNTHDFNGILEYSSICSKEPCKCSKTIQLARSNNNLQKSSHSTDERRNKLRALKNSVLLHTDGRQTIPKKA